MDQAPTVPATPEPEQVVASAWLDQTLWSAVATQIGDSIRNWRVVAAVAGVLGLGLTIAAGALSPSQLPGGETGQKTFATLGVLLLALVPYLRQHLVSVERVQAWTMARHASEQLKTTIYRHLMGVLPPAPLADGSEAPDPQGPGNLVRHCRAIKQTVAELAGVAAATVPPEKKRKTQLSLDDYLADRVQGQMNHYRSKGEAYGRSTRRLQVAEFVLGLVTVVLSALAGKLLPDDLTPDVVQSVAQVSSLLPWLALLAAATTAVTTYIASSRNAELAAKFFATYDLLKTIHDEWRVAPDRDDAARVHRFVDDIERAIASEYGGWVADWASSQQQQAPQPG
ncbi:MAG: SLATT domain-containing protein [Pseudomonadota bacterium]